MPSSPAPIVPLNNSGGRRLYEQADELLTAGPAVRVRLPGGVHAWSVTRGDVINPLLANPYLSRDPRKQRSGYQHGDVSRLYRWDNVVSMRRTSGIDDCSRLRALVGDAFTPTRIEALRPVIKATVTDLLTALARRDGTEPVDLRADFAHKVPLRLVGELFGVPAEQRSTTLTAIEAVLALDGGAEQDEARRNLFSAVETLIQTRPRAAGTDLLSHLLATYPEGDLLGATELASALALLIGSGSKATAALIGSAVRELLTHHDQRATVRTDPARWGDVIEETLRLHPPIMHLPLRYATQDIDLGEGVVIRKGEAVVIGFGAHGRDRGIHHRPADFDIDRADKQHLAFGHGLHHCLGAPLVKLEAELALAGLFERFPQLALACDPADLEPQHSFINNDVIALPVLLGDAP